MHIPKMEPPNLPWLLLDELGQGKNELAILEVTGVIWRKGPN
jgi:hypothetical protein